MFSSGCNTAPLESRAELLNRTGYPLSSCSVGPGQRATWRPVRNQWSCLHSHTLTVTGLDISCEQDTPFTVATLLHRTLCETEETLNLSAGFTSNLNAISHSSHSSSPSFTGVSYGANQIILEPAHKSGRGTDLSLPVTHYWDGFNIQTAGF